MAAYFETATARAPASYGGMIWFILTLAGGILVFWIGFPDLGEAWLRPEYSHGPLIPILSLYLLLRQLKDVPPVYGPVSRLPGLAVIVVALVIAMVGNIARIPDIVTYGMIFWIYGLVLVSFGWTAGRGMWPPVLHLVFMLPLPAFIYWKLSLELQFISSEIGVALIRVMGIPVFLDGNIIDLGALKLHVAEACSGLRYLFPILSFSYIFAVLYKGPMWHKAVLLLSAAPITILMNSFRVGAIGVMVDSYGIEHAEGFMHLFEGWVIFIACVLMLFALARLLQRLAKDRRPFQEALDMDLSGLGAQAQRAFALQGSAAMIGAVVLTGLLGLYWHAAPSREAALPERSPLVLFPRELAGWSAGPPQRLDAGIEEVLGADDYYSSAFTHPDAAADVDLFIAFYENQTEGEGIHSPEACIPAGGWEMSAISKRTLEVSLPGGAVETVPVNRAVIQKGLAKQVVYYWFEQRGRRMTSDYAAKAFAVVDGVAIGRTDGALVRLITPLRSGEAAADADARLETFLAATLPSLPQFVPR
ncbi:MAG: VPLPA-CTERM-specific exosortase XrtD [Pseudomonadota bacterium]